MALGATIYKIELEINDLDRSHFDRQSLSLARHPSETEERLMVRLLAYALHAGEGLTFGRGISNDEDATLWQHDLTGVMRLWVEVGLPDERLLRRASGRASQVILYTYGGRSAAQWWTRHGTELARLSNLRVVSLPAEFTQAVGTLASRNLKVQVMVQDSLVWMTLDDQTLTVQPVVLKE